MDSGSTAWKNEFLLAGSTASDAANYDSIHDATVFYPTSAGDGSHSSESGSRYRGMDIRNEKKIIGWINGLEQKVCCKLCCRFE